MYTEKVDIKRQAGKKRIDYFLLYLLVGMGTMPFYTGNEFLFFFLLTTMLMFIYEKHSIEKFIIYYSLFFFIIFMTQAIYYSVFEPWKVLAYMSRIIYAYFVFRILGKNIGKYYVNIIYVFTIISFLFYFPTLFFPTAVNSFLESIAEIVNYFQLNPPGRTHIIIYTFGEEYSETSGFVSSAIPRNSGPFWEPGGYGVFLILAMIFELVEKKKFFTKKNIVFLLALITTLSTASFVALFVLIAFYLIMSDNSFKALYIGSLIIIAFVVYANAFFLTGKIERDVNVGNYKSLKDIPRNRFVSAQLDLMDFIDYPIIGRGRYEATRFDTKESKNDQFLNHRNNGTTNLLVEFGFFGFIVFFGTMYQSFRNFCIINKWKISFAVLLTIIVLVLGFSQMIFNKPLFIGLSFMFLIGGRQKLVSITRAKRI
jgi:hypothetical protein